MCTFQSHEAIIEHSGHECDSLYRDAVQRGVERPVIVLLDLLDPMARDAAVRMEAIPAAFAEAATEITRQDGKPSTLMLDVPYENALAVFANVAHHERIRLEQPTPGGHYRLAVLAAGEVAFHDRQIQQ